MRDLLHPPAHRGPLIAAGALVLTIGVALQQVRTDWAAGVQFLIVLVLAVKLLWLGLQAPPEGGAPYPHQSVLIVIGLAASAAALGRLSDLLTESPGSGSFTWISAVLAGLAVFCSVRRRSAVAALIAAVAGGAALLFAWDWLFDPGSVTPFRWLLFLLAFVYGLASLPLRGESQRHSDQMVNAAGLAILAIAVSERFGLPGGIGDGWAFVVLVAGVSLVAYATADRAAGAAYLGAANLVAFGVAESEGDLLWWPLVLVVLGGVMVAIGLRPRRPLPPEPDSSTRPDDLPYTVRVHRD